MEARDPPKRTRSARWDLAPGKPKPDTFTRDGGEGRRPPGPSLGNYVRNEATEGSKSSGESLNGQSSNYREKVEKRQTKFDEARSENVKHFCHYLPKVLKLRDGLAATAAARRQQAVDEEQENLLNSRCWLCNGKVVEVARFRMVEVIDFASRFCLKVPEFKCDGEGCLHNKKGFSVEPIVADCAATAPTIDCGKWFTIEVLDFFSDLHPNNGLSGAAFGHALDNADRRFRPLGSVLLTGDPAIHRQPTYSAPIASQLLINASTEHRKIVSKASTLDLGTSDPLGNCFVCAASTKTVLSIGENPFNEEYPVAVATDAFNSANRYESAGKSQAHIPPSTFTFLGTEAQKVLEQGIPLAEEPADAAAAARVRPECTVSLTCNREYSTAERSEMDIYGMVAMVCSHTIPCLGLALAMTGHEQHAYYERLLEYFLPKRPDIKFIYLDLMCRFAHKVPTIIKKLKERGVIPEGVEVTPELLVPWMHAFDHDMGCQLKFNPLHIKGAGRRVGEQTEQLWSLMKAFAKIARYMALHHYWDGMNMLLEAITLKAQANLPATLARRIEKNEEKIVSSAAELAALETEAASRGVTDLQAAKELADATGPRAAGAASDLSRVVEAMMKLKSLDGIILHKEGIALLLPGNTGINVARQGNPDTRRRIKALIKRLLAKLVNAGTLPEAYRNELPESSPQYGQGLAELRNDVVRSMRFQVEGQVAKRNHILRALQQAEGSKNADKNRKRLKRCNNNIANLLRSLSTWEVYGTDRSPSWEATDDVIKAAYRSEFPWSTEIEGIGATEAVRRHFGVLYRVAVAQVERAEEESKYLKMEVVRLFNGLRGRIAAVDQHVCVLETMADVGDGANSAAAREGRVLAGRVKLAKLERQRLVMIEDVAKAKLEKYLPAAPPAEEEQGN